MSEPLHILVADDEPRIRTMLRRYLTDEGFRVSEAVDGAELRRKLGAERIDLILLDLMMPGEDGISLVRHVRQHSQIPVMILTGKSDLIDRVAGLESGADDYIGKPFHLREILARIRTVIRRTAAQPAQPSAVSPVDEPPAGEILHFEGWRFDLTRRELRQPQGDLVPLTGGEFDLLRVFTSHPNRILKRDQLMDLLKGHNWSAYDRAIDTQVVRLRKKIEADPGDPKLIRTVRGAGYIFTAPVTRG